MQNGHEPQKFGVPLADFALASLDGETVPLSRRLNGKKGGVVLFWSGVCSHCVRYDKFLNEFEQRYPDLALIAVASRHGETPDMIRQTMAERSLSFPLVHDPGSTIARQWFTQQTPRAFLLDAQRTLVYRGAIDNYKYPEDPEHAPYLVPAIESFLKGEPVARPETASYGCAIFSVYYILPKAL